MRWRLLIAIALFTPACSFDSSNLAGDSGVVAPDANSPAPDAMVDPPDASLDASPINLTPTISPIDNQTTLRDPVGPLPFVIGDDDDLGLLTFSVSSSNQAVVPNANIEISGSGANRSVTLTPLRSGVAKISIQVLDGNTSAFSMFELEVTNSAPTTTPDSFGAFGNTEMSVAADLGLLVNDVDADGDVFTVVPGSITSVMGASVTLLSDGGFTYLPPVGVVNASDSFTYQVFDGFEGGIGTATVTIADSELVWYVDNSNVGAGDGRSADPFRSLAVAESASAPGNVFFVYQGNGTSSDMNEGIVLKNNQRLLGESVGLTLNGTQVVPVPAIPGSPKITNGSGNGVTLSANNVVRGVIVEDTLGVGIAGVGANTIEITDVQILRTVGNAIDIVATPSAISTVTIDRVEIAGDGIDFTTVPEGISIDVNGTGGGQILCTIDNTQISDVVVGINLNAEGNTGTVAGRNSFTANNLTINRVDSDAIQVNVDGTAVSTFALTSSTIDGQDGVNGATPDTGFKLRYRSAVTSATSVSITGSTITNFGVTGVDLSSTGGNNGGILTALVRNNTISQCATRALRVFTDDAVVFLTTIDNNTMTGNGGRAVFSFGVGTTHRIDLNLTDNEDDQGFSLTRHDVGVLNLGGSLGLGGSFDDDNGNVDANGNTTLDGAPTVVFPATIPTPLQINIINPANIPEP